MLTALDGLMASLISWLVFRQPLSFYTCLAAASACGGAVLLWWIAPSHWQPDLVALTCGLLFTLYAFHVEHHARNLRFWRAYLFPFFGGLFCSMALTALTLALCFGRWESFHAMTPTDLGVLLYCGLATVLVPQVILTLLLRQMSAVTIAFFAVLEPLLSIGFASLWGKISLSVPGWCGVSLILLSLLLQVNASRLAAQKQPEVSDKQADVQRSVSSSTVG
jgi:drug/metabolite transporter (DMT)-like permease